MGRVTKRQVFPGFTSIRQMGGGLIKKHAGGKLVFALTAVFTVFFISPARCEKLYLKNGRVVNGVIIEANDKYVKIIDPDHGCPMLYLSGEIKVTTSGDGGRKEEECSGCSYSVYRNATFGLELPVPSGWKIFDTPRSGVFSPKVILFKIDFTPGAEEALPCIRVQVFNAGDSKDLLQEIKDRMRNRLVLWRRKDVSPVWISEWPSVHSAAGRYYIRRTMIFTAGDKSEYKPGSEILTSDSFFQGKKYMVKVSLCVSPGDYGRYKAMYKDIIDGFRFSREEE